MKKLFFLLLTMLAVLFLSGCGARGEIKELAAKQRVMLNDLETIASDIDKNYALWESGQISREQLSQNLSAHYEKINTIKAQWAKEKEPLSRFAKNNALFWKINHMGGLTSYLNTIIVFATQGYPSAVVQSDKKPFSNQELTACYKSEISRFNERMTSVKSEVSNLID